MNHLYYFSVIAKNRSISKASEVLHITQPALSHQLKQLEENLSCKLFDRTGRGLEINQQGIMLLNFTNRLEREASDLKLMLSDKSLRIILGIDIVVPIKIVDKFVKTLISNPNTIVEIICCDFESLKEMFLNDKVDVLISPSNSVKSDDCVSIIFGELILTCICAFNNFKDRPLLEFFHNELLITYQDDNIFLKIVNLFLLVNDVKPKSIIKVNSPLVAKDFVSQNMGYSFIPQQLVMEQDKVKELVSLDDFKINIYAFLKKSDNSHYLLKCIRKNSI